MGKIKVHGPRIEELKRNGKTYNEIAQEVGLTHEQVINGLLPDLISEL